MRWKPCPRANVFQFTPLREGRLARQNVGDCIRVFQFTPLREGRHGRWALLPLHLHFNSRPSARGDRAMRGDSGTSDDISIHAPPRGATGAARDRFFEQLAISIHAPPRGATVRRLNADVPGVFQFTPLREGRPVGVRWLRALMGFQFTPLREGRRQKICNFCKSFVQPLQISMA